MCRLRLYGVGVVSALALAPLSLLMASAAPARAQDFTVPSGVTVGQQTMNDPGDTGVIETGGTVSTAGTFAVQMLNDDQSLTNGGLITTIGGTAYGIRSSGTNAQITNTGAIATTGNAAYGIFSEGNNAWIVNAGAIATTGMSGIGIFSQGQDARIVNTGSIATTGFSAEGIGSLNDNAWIANSGTISTVGDFAPGIQSTGRDARFFNSGTILVSGANSKGIQSGGTNGQVTNSGRIVSELSDAIQFFNSRDNILTLLPGSVIEGGLVFGGGTDTLIVGNGLSIANTFDKEPEFINSNGAPFAVSGTQVAVVDPTGLAMQDEVIVDLTSGIFNSVFNALNGALTGNGNGPAGPFAPPSFLIGGADDIATTTASGPRAWANVFGSTRDQEGDSPTVDARNWLGGLISGVDGALDANSRAGAFLGGSTGQVDVAFDSQEIDVDSFYGGLYVGTQQGPMVYGLAITGGWTWNDSARRVANNLAAGGLETAKADYDGYFVSPEAAVAMETGLGVVASARARYVGYFLDGYAETGSSGNITVADRDLHILQGRVQLAMPFVTSGTDSAYTRIEPYVGLEGRTLLSGDGIDAVLLGQNLSFDPGGEDDIGAAFIGLNASARVAAATDLYGNVEAGFESDGSDRIGGNIGLRTRF